MSGEISRADFLRGRLTPTPAHIRPPYCRPEPDFRARCDRCGACCTSCETNVIGTDRDGFPILLYGQAMCTFCGACADACPTGAMDRNLARTWNVIARIKGRCLSFNGITCRACEESCEAGAIRFRLMTAGRSLPLVDEAGCTGCGACARICPNEAIDMRNHTREDALA